MKKKILLTVCALFLTFTAATAASDKIHVTMVGEFNTANPSQNIDVRVIEDGILGHYLLRKGDIIHCNIVKVTDPKRGKRSASFAVCPTSYTSEGNTVTIKENYYGNYSARILSKEELKKVDAMKVGKKAALTVGNHFVKGLTAGVTLAEGMIENEEGNPIESGVKKVYKESPLSYVEKGQELSLDSDDSFYLIFKPSNGKNSSNIEQNVVNQE